MLKIEIEIKLRITDRPSLIAALERLGPRLVHEREFEDNQLYDFPDQSLQRRGAMLRLRTLSGGALLTYKDSPRVENGAKVRDEIEVPFPDGAPLALILKRIGMVPGFRYQKYRTTYDRQQLQITLDETPIGTFVELEGPKRDIDATATALGFTPQDYIVDSYRGLYFASVRESERSNSDMLFHG